VTKPNIDKCETVLLSVMKFMCFCQQKICSAWQYTNERSHVLTE